MCRQNSFRKASFLLCPTMEFDFVDFPQKFCGEDNVDRFFFAERKEFEDNLLVKTYKLVHETEPQQILGLASIANASLILEEYPKRRDARIPKGISDIEAFPAVKIERLGVLEQIRRNGYGSILLQMLKEIFVFENRTGCRFLMADSLPSAVEFYRKNGFKELVDDSTLQGEDHEEPIPMYFNLLNEPLT